MTLPNSSSINNYGSGVLVDAVPLVDPTSELGAAALNPLRNDVAAMTTVSPRLLFQFTGSSTTPAVASTATWTAGNDSVWGNAPATLPILTRSSTGIIVVTLPATVYDQLGNPILVNIRFAEGKASTSATTVPGISCVVNSASTFTMYITSGGSYTDAASTLFVVKVF